MKHDPDRWLLYATGGCVLVCIGLLLLVGYLSSEQERTFMEECRQYRLNYECLAMWNGGHQPMPVIVPMPIPMGR